MKHTLASLWQPGRGVFIKELEPNLYIFQFYHEVDIQRVVDGSPWTFNRNQLIFQRLKKGEDPRSITLTSLELWVQLHNLKTGFMTDVVVNNVANYIGTFVKSDPKNFMGIWRDYLRVIVTINIEKPLKRRMKLKKTNGEWIWCNFKYEFIPTFCFICGLIGHSERFCPRLFDKPLEELEKPYGIWMKAEPRRRHNQTGSRWLRTGTDADAQFSDETTDQGVNMETFNAVNSHDQRINTVNARVDNARIVESRGNQGNQGVN
ncbi:uncharacterized protein LOC115715711 [Cannabis sativa]|uniref:uncharacterized protein LOC115715711 n=1 Tax=Cannabis sativa TaxID=3483 RepID=UPI0011DF4C66|nr:uncharacterized protein LOC115715711 [Cannabis sativa]